jgi:hypothetical protein
MWDELFSLMPVDFRWYQYSMRRLQQFRTPEETGLAPKTIFDGTKLPLVEVSLQDHNRWYKVL